MLRRPVGTPLRENFEFGVFFALGHTIKCYTENQSISRNVS